MGGEESHTVLKAINSNKVYGAGWSWCAVHAVGVVHSSTFGLTGAMTDTGKDEYFSLVAEAVEACGSEQGVEKDIGPFGRGAVAGEKDAALFIAAINDIVKVAGRWGLERFETEIVQHQQIWTQKSLEAALKGAIRSPPVKRLHQLGGRDEESIEALPTRFMDQSLSEVGFNASIDMPP